MNSKLKSMFLGFHILSVFFLKSRLSYYNVLWNWWTCNPINVFQKVLWQCPILWSWHAMGWNASPQVMLACEASSWLQLHPFGLFSFSSSLFIVRSPPQSYLLIEALRTFYLFMVMKSTNLMWRGYMLVPTHGNGQNQGSGLGRGEG